MCKLGIVLCRIIRLRRGCVCVRGSAAWSEMEIDACLAMGIGLYGDCCLLMIRVLVVGG